MDDDKKKQVINVITVIKTYLEDVEKAVDVDAPEKVSDIPVPVPVQDTDEPQDPQLENILGNIKDLFNTIINKQSGGRRSAKKRGTQRKQKRRQRRGSRRAY